MDLIPNKKRKKSVNDDTVDMVNKMLKSEDLDKNLLEDFLMDYQSVMSSGYSLKEYINGVKFVAYVVHLEMSYTEAYLAVFTEKRKKLQAGGYTAIQVSNLASGYNRTKLVVNLTNMAMIPYELKYAPQRVKAMQRLYDIGTSVAVDEAKKTHVDALLGFMKESNKILENNNNIQINMKTTNNVVNVVDERYDELMGKLSKISKGFKDDLKKEAITVEEIGKITI